MPEDTKHWTDPKDTSYSDKDRTRNLADDFIEKYKIMIKNPDHNIFAPLEKRLLESKNGITIEYLLDYLKEHPDMLKYVFDENGKMSKIIVDPNRMFTFLDDSFERQCNMSYGITEMLKLITLPKNSDPRWQTDGGVKIEMSNEPFCKSKGYYEPLQISTGSGDTSVSAGGSKSRRKFVRKTRRGRGRGRGRGRKSKSNAKSKTHRRRRHSRARKHKKNTNRR
jgi:hypothetical protein